MKLWIKIQLIIINFAFLLSLIGLTYVGTVLFGRIVLFSILVGLLFFLGLIFMKRLFKSESTKKVIEKEVELQQQVPKTNSQECSPQEEVLSKTSFPSSTDFTDLLPKDTLGNSSKQRTAKIINGELVYK